uniref:Uncharacterized protein n=1 Tax=Anopheles melas TaxID=34690 RepID=A0A182U1B2_9DIPT
MSIFGEFSSKSGYDGPSPEAPGYCAPSACCGYIAPPASCFTELPSVPKSGPLPSILGKSADPPGAPGVVSIIIAAGSLFTLLGLIVAAGTIFPSLPTACDLLVATVAFLDVRGFRGVPSFFRASGLAGFGTAAFFRPGFAGPPIDGTIEDIGDTSIVLAVPGMAPGTAATALSTSIGVTVPEVAGVIPVEGISPGLTAPGTPPGTPPGTGGGSGSSSSRSRSRSLCLRKLYSTSGWFQILQHTANALSGFGTAFVRTTSFMNTLYSFRWNSVMRISSTYSSFCGSEVCSTECDRRCTNPSSSEWSTCARYRISLMSCGVESMHCPF